MADFEAPSFSLGFDLTAPSFSLGLDLDNDLDPDQPPAPNQDSHSNQQPTPTIDLISSQSVEDDDLQVDDTPSPPVLKRLKRGPPAQDSQVKKRISVDNEVDDSASNLQDEGGDEYFQQTTLISGQQADDRLSAPILKRLKRGPLIQSSKVSEHASLSNEIEDISSPENNHTDKMDGQDTQRKPLTSDLQGNNSLSSTVLERLKRQLPIQSSKVSKGDSVDNEIEDISSPENNHRDDHSTLQNRSACSGSKFSLHGFAPLSTQFVSKSKAREVTQPSTASTFTSVGKSSSKSLFPKLLTSPLRKFQLLDSDSDSDSDGPSSNEDLFVDATKFDVSASKNHHTVKENLTINQQKTGKASECKLQTQDLWKDFDPQKRLNIPTPALDEFCEEYFRSVKDKNVDKAVEGDTSAAPFKIFDQKNDISRNTELFEERHNPLPPAYKYFHHNDPRIQGLVRSRLPNFFPLDMSSTETPETQAADIDYMCQFGQNEPTTRSQSVGGRSKMARKNVNQSTSRNTSEVSGSWVNPKGCPSVSKNTGRSKGRVAARSSSSPNDAGKRRVQAVGRSSGNWFTGEDGRKIFLCLFAFMEGMPSGLAVSCMSKKNTCKESFKGLCHKKWTRVDGSNCLSSLQKGEWNRVQKVQKESWSEEKIHTQMRKYVYV